MTGIIVSVACALIAGFAAAWVLAGLKKTKPDSRVEEELRQQLTQKDAEIKTLRDSSAQTATACAKAESELALKESWFQEKIKESREANEKAVTDLREAFRAMSADALKQNIPEFLRQAQETLGKFQETAKGDLDKRQESIAGLLKPLEAHLKTYQERLAQSETTQSAALGEVKKHLETLNSRSETLASETMQFRMVLKSNQARGRWGEETLRRVVEAAGMSVHCDFSEQVQSDDKKPDMVVHLPGNRVIIVDSKVPDLDFVTALDTADTEKRSVLLAEHAKKLKETIRQLAARDHPVQFSNALDYVVLFLPAESLFSAALEGDRELIVWAAKNRIMLATPASLIALLRSVSVSWQQFAETENARAITEAARELYKRVAVFTAHFDKIRAGLVSASCAFNDAVGSYEGRVKPCGEKLLSYSLGTDGKALAEVKLVDVELRTKEEGQAAK